MRKWRFVVLHFPLVHVPNILKSAEFITKGLYYSKQCKGKDPEKQGNMREGFAKYCEKENIFCLPPTILNILQSI